MPHVMNSVCEELANHNVLILDLQQGKSLSFLLKRHQYHCIAHVVTIPKGKVITVTNQRQLIGTV